MLIQIKARRAFGHYAPWHDTREHGPMSYINRMSDSADLVSGMATRLDIDFADRIAAAPEMAARSFAAMVMRCSGCRDQAACRKLQDENLMLDAAPEYCMNRDVFSARS